MCQKWTHPAEIIEIKEKRERTEYMIEAYMDGSKSENGVGSGIAVSIDKHLTPTEVQAGGEMFQQSG